VGFYLCTEGLAAWLAVKLDLSLKSLMADCGNKWLPMVCVCGICVLLRWNVTAVKSAYPQWARNPGESLNSERQIKLKEDPPEEDP
jgi:hypothetical protein